jgi:hypothetical protein
MQAGDLSMQKSAVHKARDLSPELRRAAETLLGQSLEEDDTGSLRASKGHIVKEAPTGQVRRRHFAASPSKWTKSLNV